MFLLHRRSLFFGFWDLLEYIFPRCQNIQFQEWFFDLKEILSCETQSYWAETILGIWEYFSTFNWKYFSTLTNSSHNGPVTTQNNFPHQTNFCPLRTANTWGTNMHIYKHTCRGYAYIKKWKGSSYPYRQRVGQNTWSADNILPCTLSDDELMLMSSHVIWHIRDKLWPMPKHGSIKATYVRCMSSAVPAGIRTLDWVIDCKSHVYGL